MKDMDDIEEALRALSITVNDESVFQMHVMAQALRTHESRSGSYKTAWKRLGALNNLARMSTKCERLLERHWYGNPPKDLDIDLDDAFDLINYCVFFIRQAELGEWTRERP